MVTKSTFFENHAPFSNPIFNERRGLSRGKEESKLD